MKRVRGQRRGFSLVEISVACALMVLLSALLASAWAGLGRPLLDTADRCLVAHEAGLAVACLTRDLGGYLPGNGALGGKLEGRYVGRAQPNGNELWLCFDGGQMPNATADWMSPDVLIVYHLMDGALVRSAPSTGAQFVVARHVQNAQFQDSNGALLVTLSFAYRRCSQTYTLLAKEP